MKRYLYRITGGSFYDPYYYDRTTAEKIAKEANKEIRKRTGRQAEKITTQKVK